MAKRLQRVSGPKASDFWRTPSDLFAALDSEFMFGVDLAADQENHLCLGWLGPGGVQEDAFAASWEDVLVDAACDAAFLNPPYSECERWLARCAEQIEDMPSCVIVVLVPYTPDTRWWRHTARAVEIREIPHRVRYLKADGQTAAGAMFPSAIVVFRPQPGVVRGEPRHVTWTWRNLA